MLKKLFLFVLLVFISGCSAFVADITAISNREMPTKPINIEKLPKVKKVVGQDSRLIVLFVPFGYPKLEIALNNALEKGRGDLMIDATIRYKWWWAVIGRVKIEIIGTVVNTKGGKR